MPAPRTDIGREHMGFRYVFGWRHAILMRHCPMHRHAGFELVYHPSGRGCTHTDQGECCAFEPGAVVVYPPAREHDQSMDRSGEDLCIQFETEGTIPPDMACLWSVSIARQPQLIADIQTLVSQPPNRTPLRQLVCDHRMTALLWSLAELRADGAETPGSALPASTHAERAHRMLVEGYAKPLRLEDIAAAVGMSYSRLRHLFRARYGVGLKRALLGLRLERASALLTHSPLPLKAICQLCGFASERHFCASFRAWSGLTPGCFRQKSRTNAP